MKTRNTLFPLLAAFALVGLTACGNTPSSSSSTPPAESTPESTPSSTPTTDSPLAPMLEELKTGFSLTGIIDETQVWTYNDGTTSNTRNARIVDSEAIEGYAHIEKYSAVYAEDGNDPDEVLTPNKLNLSYEYRFAANPEAGQLSQVELNANNALQYNNIIDSSTGETLEWDATFANPFALMSADMFEVDPSDENRYCMITDDYLYEPILRRLAHYIYGEPNDYVVAELDLIVKDGHIITYEGRFADYDYTGFVYTSKIEFEGDVEAYGADVTEAPSIVEGAEIPELKAALESLKGHNYTVVTEEISTDWYGNPVNTFYKGLSDGGTHIHQLNYVGDIEDNVTSDQYLYTQLSEEDSWAEGGIAYDTQIATNIKGTWYAFGSLVDDMKITRDLLPTFEISTALFEEGDSEGTYVLKKNLPDYFVGFSSGLYSLFTMNEAGGLTIDINNDQVKFTLTAASSYGNAEVTTFSDIGTTTIGNTTVKTEIADLTKWEDYFVDQATVDEVLAIIPTNVLNYVALPKLPDGGYDGNLTNIGVYTNAEDKEIQLQIRLDEYGDNVEAQYEDLLVLITAGLVKNGLELTSLDPWYGYTFEKDETINGEQVTLSISLGASGSYFLVDFALAEKTVE